MMRSHRYRYVLFTSLLFFLVILVSPINAQSDSAVITIQNVSTLDVVGELGRGSASTIALSPDNHYLAVGGTRGVQIYDLPQKTLLHTLEGHTGAVHAVAFSSSGLLASGGEDQAVRLWDVGKGTVINVLEGHSGPIRALDFSPDGRSLAVIGQGDYEARIWDVQTGENLHVLQGHAAASRALTFAPQGTGLLTADVDGVINLWDYQTGQLKQKLEVAGDIFDIVIGPAHIATAHFSGLIILTNLVTGDNFNLEAEAGVDSLDFNSDGSLLVSTDRDGKVILWDTSNGEPVHEIEQGRSSFQAASNALFTADDSQIVTLTVEGIVYTWDVQTASLVDSFAVDTREINSLAYSPNGRILAVGSMRAKSVTFWDTQTLKEVGMIYLPEGDSRVIAFSPDGKLLAAAGDGDHAVRLIDLATLKVVKTLSGHTEIVKQVVFSPDGQYLFSGAGSFFADSTDNTVRLWEVASGELVHTFEDSPRAVSDFAMSVSPVRLVVASADDTLRFYDLQTGELLEDDTMTVPDVSAVRFSPDGSVVAYTTTNGAVRTSIYVTGRTPVSYASSNSTRFAFHPQSSMIAAIHSSDSVVVTDVVTDDELFTWRPQPKRSIGSVLFNPAGTQLAIGYRDGMVELWGVEGSSTAAIGETSSVDVPAVPLPEIFATSDGLLILNLPAGWSATDAGFEAAATLRTESETMMVLRVYKDTTLADIFANLQINKSGDNIAVLTEEFSLGGRDAVRVDTQGLPGVRDHYHALDLGGGKIAQLWFSDMRQEFDDLQPTLLAILASVIVPGMETAAAETPPTGASDVQLPETFTTMDGALTFNHPSEWTFLQDDAESPAYTDRDASGVTIEITRVTDTTLEKVAANFEELSSALFSEEFTLDGRKAVRVDTSLFRGIRDYRYGIDLGGGNYGTLWLVDQKGDFENLEPTLLAILASMTTGAAETLTQPTDVQAPELDMAVASYGKSFTISYPSDLLEASAAERTPDNITMARDLGMLNRDGGIKFQPGDILLIVDFGDAASFDAPDGASIQQVADINHTSLFGAPTPLEPITIGDLNGFTFDDTGPDSPLITRRYLLETIDGNFVSFMLIVTSAEELDDFMPIYTAIIKSFKTGVSFDRVGPAGLNLTETFVRESDGFTLPYPKGWRVTVDVVEEAEFVIVTKGQPFNLAAPPKPGEPFAIVAYGSIGELTGMPKTMLNPDTNAGRVIQMIIGAPPDTIIPLEVSGYKSALVTSETDNFENQFVAIMLDEDFFVAANIFAAPGADQDFFGSLMDMLVQASMGEPTAESQETTSSSGEAETAAAPSVPLTQTFTGKETALVFSFPKDWLAVEVSAELIVAFTPPSALTAMTEQKPPAAGELQIYIYTENAVGDIGDLNTTATMLGQTVFVNDLEQQGPVTVGALSAIRYDGQTENGDVLALFIETPVGVVFMRATAPAGEMAQHEATLLALAASMGE